MDPAIYGLRKHSSRWLQVTWTHGGESRLLPPTIHLHLSAVMDTAVDEGHVEPNQRKRAAVACEYCRKRYVALVKENISDVNTLLANADAMENAQFVHFASKLIE